MIKIKVENDEYQIIKSLKENSVKRNKLNEIFVEGIECIKQAINANMEITRVIINDKNKLSNWGKNIIEENKKAKIIEMSNKLYNGLADKINPSEMIITIKMKHYKIEDINKKNPFIIIFDRPSDYGNLGTIIRSANAFGVDGIFILGHGVDIYESKVIRSSLGTIFFTKIIKIESMEILNEYINIHSNMEIIGTDSTGNIGLNEYKIKRPVMVIVGNEAKGMSIKLKEICDKIVKIPMEGNIDSLNVSCAAAIIMWEIFKNKN